MSTPRYVDYLQDVLITLHENIRELKERKNFADDNELDYIEGKLQAYQEVLSILSSAADQFNVSRQEIGL